ncbi:MAG TPA: PQQ-binding-like beta-propeller repeat protein [Pyrinomonadaceae bacterium]
MNLRLRPRAQRLTLALCLLAAAPALRAQGPTGAPPPPPSAPRLVATLEGYEGPSRFGGRPALAEFSPDGRLLALSGEGHAVKLYEAATGKLLLTLKGEKKEWGFNGFAFAPDPRVGVTRDIPDRSVSLWDLTTGKPLLKLAGRERDIETKLKAAQNPSLNFVHVPLSPDGRVVLSEREDDIVVAWDAATGKELFRLEHRTETNAAKDVLGMFLFAQPHPLMMSAAFSHDGARVVTANGDTRPKLWDASTGKLVGTLANEPYDNVYAAAFLPAAGAVITASFEGHVKLWDASTGAHRATLVGRKAADYFFAFQQDGGPVAYSPDGRLVAARAADESGKKDEIGIWDAADGKLSATVEKNKSKTLAFSPDGRTLATGGDERYSARFWDAATGKLKVALAKTEGGVRTFTYSPDGRLFVTTSDKGVRLWDAETGAPLTTLDKARYPVRFSPDGRLLVTGGTDKTAYLYELPVK